MDIIRHVTVCLYSYSHHLQEQKSHTNKNEIKNVDVVSRLEFHVLSNGALVFSISIILCRYRKMDEATETPCIQPAFSEYRTRLTRKPMIPFEKKLTFGLETILR